MSDQITRDSRTRFGMWMRDEKLYLGPLTLLGWGLLLGALVVLMFAIQLQMWQLGVLLLVGAIVFDLLFVVRWGANRLAARTIASRITEAFRGVRRVNAGEAEYATGMFTNLPADKLLALPGLLANLEELDGTDGRGNPYTLLHHPDAGILVAVLACSPDGKALVAQEKREQEVSWYAAWISSLSMDTAIAGATVIVDSALRSSAPLRQRIRNSIDPNAPEVARRATMEAADRLPSRYAESTTWAAVAYKVDALGSSLEDAHALVAAKLPYQIDALRDAGGGAVVPATSQMLAAEAQISYDPERSAEIGTDELRGIRNPMKVTEAGPEYFDDKHGRVVLHDGVASITALVLVPPRMEITSDSMNSLFAPASQMLRKRTAVLYRPVPPDQTMDVVEKIGKNTTMAATAKSQISAQDQSDVQTNRALARQIVKGATLTHFGTVVTVTFDANQKAYLAAELKLKSLLSQTGLTYRICEWDSGPAFHVTMPLGLLPWLYETAFDRMMKVSS